MPQRIRIQRLSAGSMFKLLLIGTMCSMVPLSIAMGVGALFGASTVTWNGQVLTGYEGLLRAPVIGLLGACFFTLFTGLFCVVGLWIFSKIRPMELTVLMPADAPASESVAP